MDCVLKYPGAKNRLAPWIVQYIPKHKVYLEPFAGSLAVLFHKPRCHIETVNDINEEVINFFRILRDFPEELERLLKCTPYSRTEYQRAFELTDDPMEKARRFCIRCWMGSEVPIHIKMGSGTDKEKMPRTRLRHGHIFRIRQEKRQNGSGESRLKTCRPWN